MVSTKTLALFLDAFALLNITRTQNGSRIEDITYGANPAGTIIYTVNGFMSALLTSTTPSERPLSLTLPAMDNQTDADWASAARHSLAYSGPFQFNENFTEANGFDSCGGRNGQILHGPLVTSTLPRFVGSVQRRNFSFSVDGSYLNLKGDLGDGIVDDLWWQRIEREVKFV